MAVSLMEHEVLLSLDINSGEGFGATASLNGWVEHDRDASMYA